MKNLLKIPSTLPLASSKRPIRVALYSHDTMGLGHTRRNQLIAHALTQAFPQLEVLLISGTRLTGSFALPAKADCLTLPALHKDSQGRYGSKHLSLSLKQLIGLRSKVIQSALQGFSPDVFIVDNVPRGAVNELDPVLEALSASHTRMVLGLRDVLDEPEAVQQQWKKLDNLATLERYFQAVWIYGDPRVYPTLKAYELEATLGAKTQYVGYLNQQARLNNTLPPEEKTVPKGRLALCLMGGGQDGAELAEAFAGAEFPQGMVGLLVTGPYLPAAAKARLQQLAQRNPRLQVREYVQEPTWLLQQAERVVSMGGYNTVMELLSFEKHALVVPRVKPRLEQLIRAERLRDLGVLQILYPHQVKAQSISTWLAADLGAAPKVHKHIDMNGLERLPHLLQAVLASPAEVQYV